MKILIDVRLYITLLVLLVIHGCTATQPFPIAARAGDTITLAIGSLDGATKDNLTILYTPDVDPANSIDITANIRSVFKLYPDPTSPAFISEAGGPSSQGFANAITVWSGHGPWQSVVAIDLPVTLPPGDGSIAISFGSDVLYPNNSVSAKTIDIRFTILDSPGGLPSNFEYFTHKFSSSSVGDLNRLSQSTQAVIRIVPRNGIYMPSSDIGAVEYKLNIPILNTAGTDVSSIVSDDNVRVVLDLQPQNIENQTSLTWSRSGTEITVLVMSHVGGISPAHLRFSVVILDTAGDGDQYSMSTNISINDIKTYDVNGHVIASVASELIMQGDQISSVSGG